MAAVETPHMGIHAFLDTLKGSADLSRSTADEATLGKKIIDATKYAVDCQKMDHPRARFIDKIVARPLQVVRPIFDKNDIVISPRIFHDLEEREYRGLRLATWLLADRTYSNGASLMTALVNNHREPVSGPEIVAAADKVGSLTYIFKYEDSSEQAAIISAGITAVNEIISLTHDVYGHELELAA